MMGVSIDLVKKIDAWSTSSSQLTLFCNKHQIGTATAFFWRHRSQTFLVTNWHVLSGRRPADGQPIRADGAVPDCINFVFHGLDPKFGSTTASLDLYTNGLPCWCQHADFGQKVDIGIVNITHVLAKGGQQLGRDITPYVANSSGIVGCAEKRFKVSPGMDVFVLGFPLGIKVESNFPVWKRGSIASDYDLDFNKLPAFLIDTSTREGMSGSPVYLRSFGQVIFEDGSVVHGGPVFTQFLGIYSGRRIGEKLEEAQLGVVWKQSLIDDVVRQGTLGSFELL